MIDVTTKVTCSHTRDCEYGPLSVVGSAHNNQFSKRYGKLGDVYIPRDMRTGDPRGFAFVRYLDKRDADDAIDRLDGERMNGRELRIEVGCRSCRSRIWDSWTGQRFFFFSGFIATTRCLV